MLLEAEFVLRKPVGVEAPEVEAVEHLVPSGAAANLDFEIREKFLGVFPNERNLPRRAEGEICLLLLSDMCRYRLFQLDVEQRFTGFRLDGLFDPDALDASLGHLQDGADHGCVVE